MPATLTPVADQTKPAVDPSQLVCEPAQDLARQLTQVKRFCFSGSLTQPTLHLVLEDCCDIWSCSRSVKLTAQDGSLAVTNRDDFILAEPTECPEVKILAAALQAVNLPDINIYGFECEYIAFKMDCCPQSEWISTPAARPPECSGVLEASFGSKKPIIIAFLNYSEARLTSIG